MTGRTAKAPIGSAANILGRQIARRLLGLQGVRTINRAPWRPATLRAIARVQRWRSPALPTLALRPAEWGYRQDARSTVRSAARPYPRDLGGTLSYPSTGLAAPAGSPADDGPAATPWQDAGPLGAGRQEAPASSGLPAETRRLEATRGPSRAPDGPETRRPASMPPVQPRGGEVPRQPPRVEAAPDRAPFAGEAGHPAQFEGSAEQAGPAPLAVDGKPASASPMLPARPAPTLPARSSRASDRPAGGPRPLQMASPRAPLVSGAPLQGAGQRPAVRREAGVGLRLQAWADPGPAPQSQGAPDGPKARIQGPAEHPPAGEASLSPPMLEASSRPGPPAPEGRTGGARSSAGRRLLPAPPRLPLSARALSRAVRPIQRRLLETHSAPSGQPQPPPVEGEAGSTGEAAAGRVRPSLEGGLPAVVQAYAARAVPPAQALPEESPDGLVWGQSPSPEGPMVARRGLPLAGPTPRDAGAPVAGQPAAAAAPASHAGNAMVQRAPAEEGRAAEGPRATPERGDGGGEAEGEKAAPAIDVDAIARQVYEILRRRLRVEQERALGRRG